MSFSGGVSNSADGACIIRFVTKKRIYNKLAWLNELPRDEAVYVFTECSGSRPWAETMADARPFPMLEHLFTRAEEISDGMDLSHIEKKLEAVLER